MHVLHMNEPTADAATLTDSPCARSHCLSHQHLHSSMLQLILHLSLYKLLHLLEQPSNHSIKQAFMPHPRCIGKGNTDINTADCRL